MKKILFITLIASMFASCNKFLDVVPVGQRIPDKGDIISFERLLNEANVMYGYMFHFVNQNHFALLSDDFEMTDIQATSFWTSAMMNHLRAYTFKLPFEDPLSMCYTWEYGAYYNILRFNIVIDGCNRVRTPEVEEHANQVIAQATLARAWCFLQLALAYGPPYKPGGDNSFRTIPYRTTPDISEPTGDLSTLQEVFDRILSDIHSVLRHAPVYVTSNTRFGKAQAYALLAEYHLHTRNFDSVAYYANLSLETAAIQGGGMRELFYDYNLFEWAAVIPDEPGPGRDVRATTAIQPGRVAGEQGRGMPDGPSTSTHRENLLYRFPCHQGATAPLSRGAYPSAEFIALFDTATDLRCEYFFFEHGANVGIGDGRRIMAFQSATNKINRTNGYSTPEVLLMRAEGLARTGDLAGALADLNYLRKFRHRTGTPDLPMMGQDEMIQEVINERRRELPMASCKRIFDLKRFTQDVGKPWSKQTISRTLLGVTYTADIDSEVYRHAIKNRVLEFNPHWGIPMETRPFSNIFTP